MNNLLLRRLALLAENQHRPLLAQGLRGIEREALRADRRGNLATTPHSRQLGSALTHPYITTDFSESLLEFITTAEHDITTSLRHLDALHRFVYGELDNEILWHQSMPCRLPGEEDIPIAWYGTSHAGMFKHIYRRGLALRYGKRMQCIAGLHYNFSLSEDLWHILQKYEEAPGPAGHFQSEGYIALIRNFHRHSWLLMYLFGASPALSSDFPKDGNHALKNLSDDTLYLPYATSLRMSDLGYQNSMQATLTPCYNNLAGYLRTLAQAIHRPHASYAEFGTQRNGEWLQLNTNMLQIENEYYATIRPKRIGSAGERPIRALWTHGVQYVEGRCLDINPFEPLGISLETARFLDVFLHFCALDESPLIDQRESQANTENFSLTAREGRRPGLRLQRFGASVELRTWGREILEQLSAVARLLDQQCGDTCHAKALAAQHAKLDNPELTPSARVLSTLQETDRCVLQFGLRQSREHAKHFLECPLEDREKEGFMTLARQSLEEQERLEHTQSGSLRDFIAAYQTNIEDLG